MRHYDPIYLAKYARDNDLIENPGWKQLRCFIKNTKKINCLLNTAKDKQLSNTVNIKFGMNITCCHEEEMMFGADNVNTNWNYYELL